MARALVELPGGGRAAKCVESFWRTGRTYMHSFDTPLAHNGVGGTWLQDALDPSVPDS